MSERARRVISAGSARLGGALLEHITTNEWDPGGRAEPDDETLIVARIIPGLKYRQPLRDQSLAGRFREREGKTCAKPLPLSMQQPFHREPRVRPEPRLIRIILILLEFHHGIPQFITVNTVVKQVLGR